MSGEILHHEKMVDELVKREFFLINEYGFNKKQLEKWKKKNHTFYPIETMKNQIEELRQRGFQNPLAMARSYPDIFGIDHVNMDKKISGLYERGFKNPIKMIEKTHGRIFGYNFDNIDGKIEDLKKHGFDDPLTTIERVPSILGYDFNKKIMALSKYGFQNPLKMIRKFPEMFGYNEKNIKNKIKGLHKNGFDDPIRIIEISPSILGYSRETITAKIDNLLSFGFKDPISMIETTPPILSLSENNIKRKIKYLGKINHLYKLNFDPIQILESNLPILGTKMEKLLIITRILREYNSTIDEIKARICLSYRANLECLLLAFTEKEENDNLDGLFSRAKKIQKSKISRERKIDGIKKFFSVSDNPNYQKIYETYLRAYLAK